MSTYGSPSFLHCSQQEIALRLVSSFSDGIKIIAKIHTEAFTVIQFYPFAANNLLSAATDLAKIQARVYCDVVLLTHRSYTVLYLVLTEKVHA